MSSKILQKYYNFSDEKCAETLKNKSLTATLLQVAEECETQLGTNPVPPTAPPLLYQLATKMKSQTHHSFVIKCILDCHIKSDTKLTAAIQYFKSNLSVTNQSDFENFCGIGVEVTLAEVESAADQLIGENKETILQRRYRFNKGELVGKVRGLLKWADGKVVKEVIDARIENILGPKTDEDMAPATREPKQTTGKVPSKQIPKEDAGYEISGDALNFHKVGENYTTEGYVMTPFTKDLIKKHLEQTGGIVVTRFPPEPNGILHIGHAKALGFNFGYAKAHGGICYLRFDDTNPEKEEKRFFTGIIEMVKWMGHSPYKITHASDNFQQMYEWALQLIRSGHAYVDHQKQTEIQGLNVAASPWRDRPVEDSLKLFQDMRSGLIEEGKATLRMKFTMEDGKVDPVAYRIKFTPHPRTGNTWCVYPTYDYAHCLCDSIENITHSLCTKEFQARRSAYYWLCNALNIYCPVQWEYSRLNLTGTVISKRKIGKLIKEGIVEGMDDPRLFTLTALRRRGVPQEAINKFCAKVGITQTQTVIDPSMLDACILEELDETARRAMAVLDPVKVLITNFPQVEPILLEIPDFPKRENTTHHTVKFEKEVYIEQTDISDVLLPEFRRLAPGQSVGLRHTGYIITLQDIAKDKTGIITDVKVTCSLVNDANKPKGWIHWVSEPLECEVRLYEKLFKHANPEDPKVVPGGYITDCNKDSLKVITALVDRSVEGAKELDKFQFERIGYFCVDENSTDEKLVFNRTLAMKESTSKPMN